MLAQPQEFSRHAVPAPRFRVPMTETTLELNVDVDALAEWRRNAADIVIAVSTTG
jgi:hypothetical protein